MTDGVSSGLKDGPGIIYRNNVVTKDWFKFQYRIPAFIETPPTYIMNIPNNGPISEMIAICMNRSNQQRGEYGTVWRVYPRE